jgi:20S proteasome subunit beta 4
MVNLLIGGHDDKDGASLFYMDYLGSNVQVPFAVHGYGSFFSLSVLDRYYKPDMTQAQAVELLQKCVDEIAGRFVVQLSPFKVKVIDAKGIRVLPSVSPQLQPNPDEMKE